MKNIHSLAEFAEKNKIEDTYGAIVATMETTPLSLSAVTDSVQYVSFYSFMLIADGHADLSVDRKPLSLHPHSLLRLSPHQQADILACSNDFHAVHILCDATFYEDIIHNDEHLTDAIPMGMLNAYHIFAMSETKAAEIHGLYSQIQKTIQQPHLYKKEMLTFLVHLLQMTTSEMLYDNYAEPHDLQHKENIFKIFMHLAAHNYRTHRQISYYADRMNITPTYLSRIVRQVSGNTAYGYLSGFLYNEACRLLTTTDQTLGEIALQLNFNDQSAFTNFFKQKSGTTPSQYRNQSATPPVRP